MPWTFYNASGQKLSSKGKVPVADLANGTDGELITWDASGVPATVAVGTATHVLTSNGAGAAPTFQAGGAVTREGGNTDGSGSYDVGNEATTTSTSIVDVIAASSLTIAAIQEFEYRNLMRKTSGAASGGGAGLKLNITVIATATVTANGAINVSGKTNNVNEAQNSFATVRMPATVTNYAFAVAEGFAYVWATGGAVVQGGAFQRGDAAARPTAEITDVVLTAISTASITIGLDELHVYSLATS